METIDCLLLHNPEYFLYKAQEEGTGSLIDIRNEYYRRIKDAFYFLEDEVSRGRIQYYGVSSNTFVIPSNSSDFTSLERVLEVAYEVAGENHHCRVIQFPMNLIESNAMLEKNHGAKNVLELAAEKGIATLVNRPLNAISDDIMIRLSGFSVTDAKSAIDFHKQLGVLSELEEEWCQEIAAHVNAAPEGEDPFEVFKYSEDLESLNGYFKSYEHWNVVKTQRILPQLNQLLTVFDGYFSGEVDSLWWGWRERYYIALEAIFDEIKRQSLVASHEKSQGIAKTIIPLLPEEKRKESLSRQALWAVGSVPGVSCVLNGMRSSEYVRDAMETLSWPLFPSPKELLSAVRDSPRV
jgi:aryl-alcohol dehydrogenase-like predicted oxidoreductase